MNAVTQIIQEAMHPVNLPLTWLLALSMLYWLLVILGCFGGEQVDADANADIGQADLHTDVHIDGDADLSTDAHVETDAHLGGDAHLEGGAHGAEVQPSHEGFNIAQPLLRFLHVGDMPVAPLISMIALFLWFFALLGNYHFNPQHHWGIAVVLLAPNLIVTGVIVHFLAFPVKMLFQAMNRDADAPKPIIGSICKIITPNANSEFGEAIIEAKGAPIQIHVRTSGSEILQEGQHAIVISENKDHGTFNITGFAKLQLELEKKKL
jgi:hypothetical protein